MEGFREKQEERIVFCVGRVQEIKILKSSFNLIFG